MRAIHTALVIAALLALLSPAAAWSGLTSLGWGADTGAVASQFQSNAVAKRMLLQIPTNCDSDCIAASTRGTATCVANTVSNSCTTGGSGTRHTVTITGVSTALTGTCASPDASFDFPAKWGLEVSSTSKTMEFDLAQVATATEEPPTHAALCASLPIFTRAKTPSCYCGEAVLSGVSVTAASPSLNVSISAGPDTDTIRAEGGEVSVTVRVENTGNVQLQNVNVSLPGAVVALSAQEFQLSPKGYKDVEFKFTLRRADLENGKQLIPSASGKWIPKWQSTLTAKDAAVSITPSTMRFKSDPKLWMAHVIDGENSTVFSEADEIRSFTVTVRNEGGITLKDVTISNSLPSVNQTLTCTTVTSSPTAVGHPLETLVPGAAVACTGTYTVTSNDVNMNRTIINSASAAATASPNGITTPVSAGPIVRKAVPKALALRPSFFTAQTAPVDTYVDTGSYTAVLRIENTGEAAVFVHRVTVGVSAGMATASMVRQQTGVYTVTASQRSVAPRPIREPRPKNKRAASQLTVDLSADPVKLNPTKFFEYLVQLDIPQDALDVNQVFIVTPQVEARGPANLKNLTGSQLNPDEWKLSARQTYTLAVKVAELKLKEGRVPLDGDTVPISLSVANTGNVRLNYADATVTVGKAKQTLTLGDCNKAPDARLEPKEANMLTCTFDYKITQQDIESLDYLIASAKFDMFYYKCPDTTSSSCQGTTTHSDSKQVQLLKEVTMTATRDATVASTEEYNRPGDVVTVTYVLKNTGNTILNISEAQNTCSYVDVKPGQSSQCTLAVTATQEQLNYGSITRTLQFKGTPSAVSTEAVTLDDISVRFDAVATGIIVPSIAQATTVFSKVGDIVTFNLGCTNNANLDMNVTSIGVKYNTNPDKVTAVCGPELVLAGKKCTDCKAEYAVTQLDLENGFVKATVYVNALPPWEDKPEQTDWKTPRAQFAIATGEAAEVPASQAAWVLISQTASLTQLPDKLQAGQGISVTVTTTFNNTGNVWIRNFAGVTKSGETVKCSKAAAGSNGILDIGEVVTCEDTFVIDNQADFEAGISLAATATGKYIKNGTETPYTDSKTFTLDATPNTALNVVLTCGDANSAGTATCTANVKNTGNWRLVNLVFSSDAKASVTCSPDAGTALLQPGAEVTCDASVQLSQKDFDDATDLTADKNVDVTASASVTVKGNTGVVQHRADSKIKLIINPRVELTVGTKQATITPTLDGSGMASTVDITVANTGNVKVKWDNVQLERAGVDAGVATRCSGQTLAPQGSITCSAVVNNTLQQCNDAMSFSFKASLSYKAAEIDQGNVISKETSAVNCPICRPNQCPAGANLPPSLIADAFSLGCDCTTNTLTVNFRSHFRNGDCEKTPVSRIFMFTKTACQMTGGVSKDGIARLAGVSANDVVQVMLHDNLYRTASTVFPSDPSMLASSKTVSDLFKGYKKSNCNVGNGNLGLCGSYSSWKVPADANTFCATICKQKP
ncbi:hypothetical protein OEZ85_013603 [Tetradesmus obliquus]|uniref:DUF7507 domain-containing protein n=1 Tax=Tetradesmus obliquus TaxID=3088 RepID=A0ABY8UQT8_TETOB|nr:hypothetical protein OEZ85_013603 [Tetradesmus obliquus]